MVDGSRYVLNIDSPMIDQKTDAYLMQYSNVGHPQTSISQHKLQYQKQNSPYNNNNINSGSIDRGSSSITSSNLGGGMLGSSTFKSNQGKFIIKFPKQKIRNSP